MNRNSTAYTFFFALAVCVVCSFTLAAVSTALKGRQQRNKELDIKKNILKVVQLRQPLPKNADPQLVLKIYEEKIEEAVVDAQGRIVEGKKPSDLKEGEEGLYPLYIYREGDEVLAYAFPIVGKGLWSTLKGYMAIESDGMTVRGITFYEHGETPGLGAEIEKEWFQNNFKGKKIFDQRTGTLHPVELVKGHVKDKITDPYEAAFYVDGISGATMTSKGVTAMIRKWIQVYDPFFSKLRARKLRSHTSRMNDKIIMRVG